MIKKAAASDSHRATSRVLDVLEHLAATGETATLAELSAQLQVPKTSLLPLLRTLVARHWIEKPQAACYQIARGRLFTGNGPNARMQLPQIARPFLERLTDETQETTFLGVLPPGADAVVYIDKVESPQRIRYSAELGEQRPVHATAVGMALFAFLPEKEREAMLTRLTLDVHTPHTMTDRAALKRRLLRVAKEGVAITFEEFVKGAGAIASPIFGGNGQVTATCGLAGPIERMRRNRDRYVAAVKRTAHDLSVALGYHSPKGGAVRHG